MTEEWFLFSGKDLIGVQNLLKKHQALQAEIAGHEPRIKAVTQKGAAMAEEGECSSLQKTALLCPQRCPWVLWASDSGGVEYHHHSFLTVTLTRP